ncbi:hypothetical protein [Micromonospora sp. DPT]|uniref:hypothetical protein n=1 Tax=Micromonospora sp. DPT TaxID=3142975 RepID=UPI003209367E
MARQRSWKEVQRRIVDCFRRPDTPSASGTTPLNGRDTDPVAQALEVWLDARSRLEAAVEPVFQRLSTPLDLVHLNDLLREETLAWDHFRTVRLTDTNEGGQ